MISIHAPAKGATFIVSASFLLFTISIHAPAKGATPLSVVNDFLGGISIHAPAKGATAFYFHNLTLHLKFQSTLPRRERRWLCHVCFRLGGFQSTLPRRERLTAENFQDVLTNFNPRSREGSDLFTFVSLSKIFRFQSTLPRRERLEWAVKWLDYVYKFQSTLPRRERPR